MPYIDQRDRSRLDPPIALLIRALQAGGSQVGEINYVITRIVLSAGLGPRPHYTTFAMLIGVLETCKLEMYRRLAAPYEDKKAEENGDVYAA